MNVAEVQALAGRIRDADRQGRGRPERHHRPDADGPVRRRPHPAGRSAGHGQDPAGAQCFAQRGRTCEFGRIQFTPDLMPGDILGANLFNFQTSAFTLVQGADLLRAAAGRRDQPHAAQDASRAAGGHAGAQRHPGRRAPSARRPRSWWWPPRTRWSSRAPIRCPRPSSTASCSSTCWPIPAWREEEPPSSPATAPARASRLAAALRRPGGRRRRRPSPQAVGGRGDRAARPTTSSATSSAWCGRRASTRRARRAAPRRAAPAMLAVAARGRRGPAKAATT